MVEIATSRSEVIDEIITKVKQMDSTASIVPGTPLYDLLVYHFADVITEERELVNIATNIARVSPMFGNDGRLLEEYADMDTYLTDRFFLTRPEYNEIYDTLYVKFSRATGVNILASSSVYYNSVKLAVLPTFISPDSPLWKKAVENGKPVYYHPVDIDLASDTDTFIPATDQWVTGGIKISTGSRVFVLGAESKKAVNTYVQPEVTLEYLRDSISNRSLSNARSILYNLRNSLGFNPDKLKKARVMHTMEPEFIERRKILFSDPVVENTTINDRMGQTAGGWRTMSAIVSGDGKILLDYGVSLQKAPVDAIHIDRSDPLYSELNPFIEDKNPDRIIQEININGLKRVTGHFELEVEVEGLFPDQHTVYYVTAKVEGEALTAAGEEPEIIHYEGKSEKIYDSIGFERIWLTDTSDTSENPKPKGWVSIDCQLPDFGQAEGETIFKTGEFEYHRDLFMLYRIDTRGLGLFSPVSIGSDDDMDYLKSVMESIDVNDLLAYGAHASVSYPGSTLTVHQPDDAVNRPIDRVDFVSDRYPSGTMENNNVLSLYSDPLYWKITTNVSSGNKYIHLSTDPTFKNKGYGVFLIDTTRPELDCKIGANITLRFTWDQAGLSAFETSDNVPSRQYFTLPAAFLRNSNRYLVFAINPNGVISDEDYAATLLYYGTEPSYMTQAQELYLNKRLAEIGNRIIVAPFRPVVFTAYWGPEYVTQYMSEDTLKSGTPQQRAEKRERYDALRSQFIELQAFIEDYMSDYTGNIGDFDFAEMVKEAQAATGLILKRLDYTLFTQRGYPVRGVLDINLDQTCLFDWTKNVTDVIKEAVDDSPKFIKEEMEFAVTSEDMYRPLFSRVGV